MWEGHQQCGFSHFCLHFLWLNTKHVIINPVFSNTITWFCRINWSLSLRATLSSWERYCNVSLGLEIFKIGLAVSD